VAGALLSAVDVTGREGRTIRALVRDAVERIRAAR